jgi:hypothetical protein
MSNEKAIEAHTTDTVRLDETAISAEAAKHAQDGDEEVQR